MNENRNRDGASTRPERAIEVLLSTGEGTSIVDTLLLLPDRDVEYPGTEWDRAMARRLELMLSAQMRSLISSRDLSAA